MRTHPLAALVTQTSVGIDAEHIPLLVFNLISELKGKWKLSQNRSEEDRLGVIAGLKNQSNASAAEMLHWMGDDDGGA